MIPMPLATYLMRRRSGVKCRNGTCSTAVQTRKMYSTLKTASESHSMTLNRVP
jgi:hypothetical protein